MARIQVTWVVKTSQGQVKGPYSTQAILQMIGEGVFSGQEMISKLPDGQWTLITKEPAFYDKLLEALEGVVDVDPDNAKKMEAETVIMRPPAAHKPDPPKPEKSDLSFGNIKVDVTRKHNIDVLELPKNIAPAATTIRSVTDKDTGVIDLSNIDGMEKSDMLQNLRLPALILLVAAGLIIYAFLPTNHKSSEKLHLLAPAVGKPAISDAQVATKLKEALGDMSADTFDSYLDGENKLVSIVEGAPLNQEVRALLCVTYKQLWPFAQQDAQDVKTVATLTQTTRALSVVSPYGQVCEAVKLITNGRYKEARSVIEATLEGSDNFSLLPVLYEFKAEMLQGEKDLDNAIPYYEKSIQMWGGWLRPQVALAQALMEKGAYPEANNALQTVLQKNPKHREARIMMGLVQYNGFKQMDAAYAALSAAMDSHERVPQYLEAQGAYSLAELLVLRGEKKKALNLAEKAFALNPNNSDARQLVLRLGGSDKVKTDKNQNNELLYLGDQYVRQGDNLAAQAEFKAAFEVNPKNGTAAMKAAKALWQLNQSFEAIEWLGKAMKAEPNLVSAYVLDADYLSQRFDFTKAFQVLANATRIAPNNYEVLRGLALLEFRKNNMAGTIAYALRSMKVYDGDIDTYILLAKANAQLAQTIVPSDKKEIDRKDNAAKDAIRYATKAVEIDATNSEAQIVYAKILAQANGVDAGITYLNEMIKRFSYTLDYRIALAEVYRMEDRYTQAQDIYTKVVDADAKNKKAWLGLGDSNRALGLNDAALKAFLTAAVLDPTDGEALFQAGKLYYETARYEEAIQQFKRVQRLNPNFPRTYYYIGRSAFASGDLKTALEAAKNEKKENPNMADSYVLSAEIYDAKHQYSDCANEYSQAMKLRPQGADIYVKAAHCYRQSGDLDVAGDMLALASSRESGYPDIYKEQGAIYEMKGDSRSAAAAYNKYLGLSPNAPDRAEIENKISKLGN